MIKNNRLPFIDSLRGLAALYVFVFHIVRAPEFHLPLPKWIRPFIFNGSSGVALFFILSGFTLSYTLHNKIKDRNSYKKFYIRRFFRIAPLYYSMLIFFIILVLIINPSYINIFGVFLYSTFTFNLVPNYQEGLVPASWTIGIEMIFYLLFPFIFLHFDTLKKSILQLSLISLLTFILLSFKSYFPPNYISILFITNMPLFLCGIVCYFICLKPFTVPAWKIYITVVSIILLPYLFPNPSFFLMTPFYSFLIIGLCKSPMKIITNRITGFYGTLSYSVYLLHPKIITSSSNIYKDLSSYGHNTLLTYLFCIFITLIPLTILSYLTYSFIELPGINYGHKIAKRLS